MNKNTKKWKLDDIENLYRLPFNDLIYKAHSVHREHHDPNKIQVSTLMSIKTGGCPVSYTHLTLPTILLV